MNRFIEWMFEKVLLPLCGLLILVLIFIVAPIVIYQGCTSEKITLTKKDWQCTANHYESTSTSIIVGKVIVPQTSRHMVCDEYKRVR